jgi:hypothetical protein
MHKYDNIVDGIVAMIGIIQEDYAKWNPIDLKDETRNKMVKTFNEGIRIDHGSKFIRIWTGTSSHSFIAMRDFTTKEGKTFKKGDILKCATWRAPALNFRRGNVLEGDFHGVRWTGAQ